ncbi:MAG TPA: c-type cytochrome biogenesis protein CcsB [Candidatus Omnitrophica bacterium]|nr:c-type cytochrome biogenesis protein CcsB [Candidatus Omnitrophota bacterium]
MLSIYLNIAFAAYFTAMIFYFMELFFKSKLLPNIARLFLVCGILSLTVYMGLRWHIAGRPPLSNMFESLVVFAWAIAVVFIFIDIKYKIKTIAAPVALMSLITLGYASMLDKEIVSLLPALKSNWLTIHVLTCFIGYAALAISFISSLILLFKKSDSQILDVISHKMIAFGFLFLTLGIITGAVWANSSWGTYWSWDPKETWSLVTWIIYALYLHVRLRRGWKGKKAAWVSVIGFLAMLFTYFGVNYLLSGLHSYA